MENNSNFVKYFYISAGLITILFCISVPINKIENQFQQLYESELFFNEKAAEKDFEVNTFSRLKINIENLNFNVDQTANQISTLIFNAGILNDSILRMMNNPAGIFGLADSLTILERTIRQSEFLVDSLNKVFEENSGELLKMMERYDKNDQEIKLLTIELTSLEKYVYISKVLLITRMALFVMIFLLGSILLIKGLTIKNHHKIK